MRNALICLTTGVLLAALFAELALRALPVSTGYDFGAVDAREPIMRGSPHFKYTFSRGWNFRLANSGSLNNYGFRSTYDYAPDPHALIVIGNSYVQADALDPRDTLAERLGGLLRVPAYGVGVDGFSLPDYLAAARWSKATFRPQALLIVLTTGDLDHGCGARLGEHYFKYSEGKISLELAERATPSRGKRWINQSHLFRYVFDNLRVAATWSRGWRRVNDSDTESRNTAGGGCVDLDFRNVATQFLLDSFAELKADGTLRIIFLLAPNYRLEQGISPGQLRDVDGFADRAVAAGYEVVRMDSEFLSALRAGTRLDFLPIDGHWTSAANLIAARSAAAALATEVR